MRYFAIVFISVIFSSLAFSQTQIADTLDFCATDSSSINAPASMQATTWNLKVLLVEFTDVKHRNPTDHNKPAYTFDDWENLFFSEEIYVSPNMYGPDGKNAYGSMRDYFDLMSDGEFELDGYILNNDTNNDNIPDWIQLPNTKDFYGNNSILTFRGAALSAASTAGLDISTTDPTTQLAIIYAGHTYRRKPNGLGGLSGLNPVAYPHPTEGGKYVMGELFAPFSPYNQERADAIFSGIGINAHEFGHLLGWPDTFGNDWDLMNGGAVFPYTGTNNKACSAPAPPNPKLRHDLGWLSYTEITTNSTFDADYNLKDPEVFQIKDSTLPLKYILIENRHFNATMTLGTTTVYDYNHFLPWDFFLDTTGLPDQGLIVWRFSGTGFATMAQADGFNNSANPVNAYELNGSESYIGDAGDVYPGYHDIRVVSPWSFPSSLDNNFTPTARITSNAGFEIANVATNHISVDFYVQNPENASPSTPRILTVSGLFNTYPVLNWELNDGEPDRTNYKIYKKKGSSPFQHYATVPGTQDFYIDYNETIIIQSQANETYAYYKITAVDNQSKESTYSNTADILVEGDPETKLSNEKPIVSEVVGAVPNKPLVYPNFPNPFNPTTTIRFTLPESKVVEVLIYDTQGRLVRNILRRRVLDSGEHQFIWDGRNEIGDPVASGVYLYTVQAGKHLISKKMLMLK